MRAAAQMRWGAPALAGRTVGISGVGKVGRHLVPLLLGDGADVVVTDVDPDAIDRVRAEHDGRPGGRVHRGSCWPSRSTSTPPAPWAGR